MSQKPALALANAARPAPMPEIGILIIDDDLQSQAALRRVLDSEGWRVRVVPGPAEALQALTSGEWSLAIANVVLAGPGELLFATLRDLSHASPAASDAGAAACAAHKRLKTLFLVPATAPRQSLAALEKNRLPYCAKPLHLQDLLEKVSDLLLEAQAIAEPIRLMRGDSRAKKRRHDRSRGSPDRMFASREDYQMTEEEILEFEREEAEERKRRQKKQEEQKG